MGEPTTKGNTVKLIPIDEQKAETLTKQKNIWWDGWDLMLWSPNPHGFTQKRGAFRNGRWGMLTRIPVSMHGKWEVPAKYVRTS